MHPEDHLLLSIAWDPSLYGLPRAAGKRERQIVYALGLREYMARAAGVHRARDTESRNHQELTGFVESLLIQHPQALELLWVPAEGAGVFSPAMELIRARRGTLLSTRLAHAALEVANHLKRQLRAPAAAKDPLIPPGSGEYLRVLYNFTNQRAWNERVPHQDFAAQSLGGGHYLLWFAKGHSWLSASGRPRCQSTAWVRQRRDAGEYPLLLVAYDEAAHAAQLQLLAHAHVMPLVPARKRRFYHSGVATEVVRLLSQALSLLQEGEITYPPACAEILCAIHAGSWTLGELETHIGTLESQIRAAARVTGLPARLDQHRTRQLMLDAYEVAWGRTLSCTPCFPPSVPPSA